MLPKSIKRISFTVVLGMCLGVASFAVIRSDADTHLLGAYHRVGLALANDKFDEAVSASVLLVQEAENWLANAGTGNSQEENVRAILEGAKLFSTADAEKDFRTIFGQIAKGTIDFIRQDTGLQNDWNLWFCPMFEGYAYWPQPKADPKKLNPYKGNSMQQCGLLKPWKEN